MSISCCFIQREVRTEALVFFCNCFKSADCYEKYPRCVCCDPSYTVRRKSTMDSAPVSQRLSSYEKPRSSSSFEDERHALSNSNEALNKKRSSGSSRRSKRRSFKNSTSSSTTSTNLDFPSPSHGNKIHNWFSNKQNVFLECLFDTNESNDFHKVMNEKQRRKSIFDKIRKKPPIEKLKSSNGDTIAAESVDYRANQLPTLTESLNEQNELHVARTVKFDNSM